MLKLKNLFSLGKKESGKLKPEQEIEKILTHGLDEVKLQSITNFDENGIKQFNDELITIFDVEHLNETLANVPQAPIGVPFTLNTIELKDIKELRVNNITTPFQKKLFKFKKKIKNLEFTTNIFVYISKFKQIFKSFKVKYVLMPLQKINKHIEKQIFLSNLTRQQRESIKSMNFDTRDMNYNSALIRLVIQKNFDLKSLKDNIEKQKKRQKERDVFYKKLRGKITQ